MVYQCHYPTRSMQTARGAKRSAIHDRLAARGRVLQGRERLGGRRLVRAAGRRSRSRARSRGAGRTGSPYWEAEHQATREGVILMDMSFMSKFLVQGRDAGRVLDRHLGERRRRRARRHHLHAVAQRGRHARGRPHGHQARRRAVLGRRDRHRAPPRRDVDAPAHPGRRARVRHRRDVGLRADQRAGPALARADAVADDGRPVERGVPVPHGARDRHRLRARRCASASPTSASSATSSTSRPSRRRTSTTGSSRRARTFGLRHAGLKALASLRMEKGYRDYGHDIDNTDSVLEAGLGFAVDLEEARRLHRPRRGAGEEGRRAR